MDKSNPTDKNNLETRDLPIAKVVKIRKLSSPKQGIPQDKFPEVLELQVNIGGQDQNILLPVDAIREYDTGGLAVAAALLQIRESLDAFAMAEFSSKMDVLIDVLQQQKNQ